MKTLLSILSAAAFAFLAAPVAYGQAKDATPPADSKDDAKSGAKGEHKHKKEQQSGRMGRTGGQGRHSHERAREGNEKQDAK
jgi:hypothetical protein